jgi:hypothetical protein
VRLSDADREQLYEQLSRHAAAGRIGIEELERRVAAVDAAETREQAAAVVADLPPLSGAPSSERGAAWKRWGRGRGHAAADQPQPDWQPTGERFRDPGTNEIMRVWVDSAGGRHYLPDSE